MGTERAAPPPGSTVDRELGRGAGTTWSGSFPLPLSAAPKSVAGAALYWCSPVPLVGIAGSGRGTDCAASSEEEFLRREGVEADGRGSLNWPSRRNSLRSMIGISGDGEELSSSRYSSSRICGDPRIVRR